MPITKLRTVGKILMFSHPKHDFIVILASYDTEPNNRVAVLLHLLNCLQKGIKCSTKPCILTLFSTHLIISIINEYS